MKSSNIVACLTLLLSASGTCSQQLRGADEPQEHRELQQCKPVSTQANFDMKLYASKTWYVHQQAVTRYLPEDRNYCVTADYTVLNRATFPWGYTVEVNNRATDSTGQNSIGGTLGARQDGSGDPAKLQVSPRWLPSFFAGPYWVLLHNEEEGYALVSGGQPNIPTTNGLCQTRADTNNGSGLWIFLRDFKRNNDLIKKVQQMATDMGIDISVLNDVDQTICGW